MKDYYLKKDERARDIRLIANELGKSEAEIGKKWHNLKTTFDRIHKRLAGKSGDPALDPNATKWIHYEELMFVKSVLNDPSTSSLTQGEIEPLAEQDDDSEVMSDTTSSLSSRPISRSTSDSAFDPTDSYDGVDQANSDMGSKRSRKRKLDESRNQILKSVVDVLSVKEDDVTIYLKGIAPTLRKLDPQLQEVAKFQINNLLFQLYQQQAGVVIVQNQNQQQNNDLIE